MIPVSGKIIFDPENKTKKHEKQSSWKKVAIIQLESDLDRYYAWFLKRRYSIELQPPLRGPHVTFINDKYNDIETWNKVKSEWNGQTISFELNPDVRTNSTHWWLNVTEESREKIHKIRNQLDLGRPYFGLHMSIGYPNEKNIEHSIYIHELLKNNLTW